MHWEPELEGAGQAPKDSWEHPEVLQELSRQEVGLDARLGEHRQRFPNIFLGKFCVGHEGAVVGFGSGTINPLLSEEWLCFSRFGKLKNPVQAVSSV